MFNLKAMVTTKKQENFNDHNEVDTNLLIRMPL